MHKVLRVHNFSLQSNSLPLPADWTQKDPVAKTFQQFMNITMEKAENLA